MLNKVKLIVVYEMLHFVQHDSLNRKYYSTIVISSIRFLQPPSFSTINNT